MALGWAYTPEDWRFSADTAMAFVVEEDGVVIGTAMCWKFGADRASIGHLIVSPAHQGRGLGRGLMELLLQEVSSRITFLHATPAGRPLYEKLGFVVCGSLEQYQGTVGETLPMALPDGEKLRIATPEDFPFLIEMDARASRLERPALLSALLRRGQGLVLERDGRIIGFSVLRPFGWGYVIGPVIAPGSPDDRYARTLIGYWLASRQGEFVRVDIPVGTTLTDWLPRQGLKLVDVCAKMVRNASADASGGPSDPAYRLYALISQAML
ncbi:N-acetyltransferase domain-containing protein [Bordetella sputigena]|uniref:GNAT family N-acetyltransferase n=1 Tax=Bordetella sputigena TaxID=1416810 RepID=UPI0039F0812B